MMADFLAFLEKLIAMAGGPAMFGVHMLGGLLAFGAIAVLLFAQFSPSSKFDAAEMLEENGHTSATQFLKLIGGLASVWIMVLLAVSNHLDAMIFTVWLGLIFANSLGQKALDKWKQPMPPTTTTETETTATERTTTSGAPQKEES